MAAKTDTTPYHGHFALYLSGFIVAMLLFAGSAYLAAGEVSQREIAVFRAINDWPDSLRALFRVSTIFPGSLWIAAAAIVLTTILRMPRLAWRLAACALAGYAISLLSKHFIDRPRPQGIVENIHLRATENGMGYPSSHVLFITIIMLAVLPYLPWRWRWVIPVPIILMALSRIYLGLNLPLDVLGGFAVGLGIISFVRILPQPFKVLSRLD